MGCGPVGMRFAIEAVLLGCDVIVVEKTSSFSCNNVLQLWPFTIDDLRRLGAKKFRGQFCAGQINHISKLIYLDLPYCCIGSVIIMTMIK